MNKIRRLGGSFFLGACLTLGAGVVVVKAAPLETTQYSNHAVQQQVQAKQKQEFWIVTNEIKAPAKDDMPEIEAYRWDPGFLVVDKGQPVTLHIYGVKGKEHPFVIEGLNVKGDVKKGKVTTVTFTPEKVGTFKIICLTHPTMEMHGPMIAYLRVE